MRTIKQLLKDSDLSSVSFYISENGNLIIKTNPLDEDLEHKIQEVLDKEIDHYLNKIN